MSARLPILRPSELIRALERAGFQVDHQTGSHMILYKTGHLRAISVPRHSRDLRRPTQERIIKDAGFTLEEFRLYL